MNTPTKSSEPEFWLQGPIPNISVWLQPAAHALLQSRRELYEYTKDFSKHLLWEKPYGRASVGFHIQHMTGVVDRMLTYAASNSLSENQFTYLKKEGKPNNELTVEELVENFSKQVAIALQYFEQVSESSLTEKRTVGRKKLPSTVIGLLFHAAEHSQRHMGQVLVTMSVLEKEKKG